MQNGFLGNKNVAKGLPIPLLIRNTFLRQHPHLSLMWSLDVFSALVLNIPAFFAPRCPTWRFLNRLGFLYQPETLHNFPPFACDVLFDFLFNHKTPICLSRFPIQPVHSCGRIIIAPVFNGMTESELVTYVLQEQPWREQTEVRGDFNSAVSVKIANSKYARSHSQDMQGQRKYTWKRNRRMHVWDERWTGSSWWMDRKHISGRGGDGTVPEHGPQEGEGNRVPGILKLLKQESFKSERLDGKSVTWAMLCMTPPSSSSWYCYWDAIWDDIWCAVSCLWSLLLCWRCWMSAA